VWHHTDEVGDLDRIGLTGWAGVSTTGDTKDDGSTFSAGYNANTTGGLTIDAGSVFIWAWPGPCMS